MERRQSTGGPHHAVLRVQHPRLPLVALKQRRLHAKTLADIIVNHRPQLFVIPQQNNLEGGADTSAAGWWHCKVHQLFDRLFVHRHSVLLIYVMLTATSAKDHIGHDIKILF